MKIRSCDSAKNKIETVNGFIFCTFIGRFQMAGVKGVKETVAHRPHCYCTKALGNARTRFATFHRRLPRVVGWVLLYVHRNRRLIRDGSPGRPPRPSHSSWALFWWLVECCFTSTETVGLLGTGAQDGHLDPRTTPELCSGGWLSVALRPQKPLAY